MLCIHIVFARTSLGQGIFCSCFFILKVTSGRLADVVLCKSYSKSQHNLHSSFSMAVPLFHLSLYHTVFILLYLFRYSVAASPLHSDNQCIIVSFACLRILHFSLSTCKPLFAFHALVSTNCSCAAKIDATFFGSILHCSRCAFLIYSFLTFLSLSISVFCILLIILFLAILHLL